MPGMPGVVAWASLTWAATGPGTVLDAIMLLMRCCTSNGIDHMQHTPANDPSSGKHANMDGRHFSSRKKHVIYSLYKYINSLQSLS